MVQPVHIFKLFHVHSMKDSQHERKTLPKSLGNEEKAPGINLPDLTENEQSTEEIIARKMDATVIHEHEPKQQKDAEANAEETKKRCLEKYLQKQIEELLKQTMKRMQEKRKDKPEWE